jgi:hypothetical protein
LAGALRVRFERLPVISPHMRPTRRRVASTPTQGRGRVSRASATQH